MTDELNDDEMTEMGADTGVAGTLPSKVPGQHRWIATVGYSITEEQAAAEADVVLDHENRFTFAVGCLDCEVEFRQARGTPCLAGDDWTPEPQPHFNMRFDDPRESSAAADPVGGRSLDPLDLQRVILLDGVGVSAVETGRIAEGSELRLALSLIGRLNKQTDKVHHLYMLDGDMVGVMTAQLLSLAGVFPEFEDAFGERMVELQTKGQMGPPPFKK